MEEVAPQTGLALALRGDERDRRYQVFLRRTRWISRARLVRVTVAATETLRTVGYLAEWAVDANWQNQKVGRWLLRRVINDATQYAGWPKLSCTCNSIRRQRSICWGNTGLSNSTMGIPWQVAGYLNDRAAQRTAVY